MPATVNVAVSTQQQFTASVTGATNTAVTWSVLGAGCSAGSCGTISKSGLYNAPATIPNPATVSVQAVSVFDASKSGTATVTVAVDALAGPIQLSTTAGGSATTNVQLTGVTPTSTLPFLLSCTGLPAGAACSFANTSSNVSGAIVTGQNPLANVTIFTSGSSSGISVPSQIEPGSPWRLVMILMIAVTFMVVWRVHRESRQRRSLAYLTLIFLCLFVGTLSSCVGYSQSSVAPPTATATPRGSYLVVITATPQVATGGGNPSNYAQTQLIIPFTVN
jgi:hypothetical protein